MEISVSMKNETALTNVSFDYLKGSSEFLNLVLNDISSCILLLNSEMSLFAYNDALKNIFSNKEDEHILYKKCGEVLGCAFTVEESTSCGSTSQCRTCSLRLTALYSYMEKKPVYKQIISREFYKTDNSKELKHLQFSTRLFKFEQNTYIVLMIEDITDFINLEKTVYEQKALIEKLSQARQ